jgi:hypothetical protein
MCARGTQHINYLLHGCHHKHPMHGLRLVFPPAAAAILWFPVNEIPNILQIRATVDVYDFVMLCWCTRSVRFRVSLLTLVTFISALVIC